MAMGKKRRSRFPATRITEGDRKVTVFRYWGQRDRLGGGGGQVTTGGGGGRGGRSVEFLWGAKWYLAGRGIGRTS